jgi:hypothetical protein
MRFYEARFAPNAETVRAAVRVSQRALYHGEIVAECFQPQAFRAAGVKASEVPVLIDHDLTKGAGTVTTLVAHGDWHIASFPLDGPYAREAAELIERSGRVSPSFTELDKDPISAREPCPMNWYTAARLDEISILSPGAIAWYVGAKVTRVYEPKASPARTTLIAVREIGRRQVGRDLVIDMSDGSEVIYHGAGRFALER